MVLVGIHEGMIALGRHKHQRENNIKMHLKGYSVECLKLIRLAQDRDKGRLL